MNLILNINFLKSLKTSVSTEAAGTVVPNEKLLYQIKKKEKSKGSPIMPPRCLGIWCQFLFFPQPVQLLFLPFLGASTHFYKNKSELLTFVVRDESTNYFTVQTLKLNRKNFENVAFMSITSQCIFIYYLTMINYTVLRFNVQRNKCCLLICLYTYKHGKFYRIFGK